MYSRADWHTFADTNRHSHRSRYSNADSHGDSKPNTYTYSMSALYYIRHGWPVHDRRPFRCPTGRRDNNADYSWGWR